MSFSAYSTPHPQTRFSNESFREITVAEADDIVRNNQLPHILPKNTATSWVFTREVPIAVSEIIVAAGEFIPCLDDLLPITQAMEFAFSQQGRALSVFSYPTAQCATICQKYIRLALNLNNQVNNLHLMSDLLDRVIKSSLLLPNLIDEFKRNKFTEPLAGFLLTDTPLYSLGCLLDERWAIEDVLNARAELTYF
ncbi:hypothetical protein B0H13DRAFT_1618960, partial [Mycena leptocephala]